LFGTRLAWRAAAARALVAFGVGGVFRLGGLANPAA
jgi:hypothetical protein